MQRELLAADVEAPRHCAEDPPLVASLIDPRRRLIVVSLSIEAEDRLVVIAFATLGGPMPRSLARYRSAAQSTSTDELVTRGTGEPRRAPPP